MFNENQITVKENPISKLNDTYTAMGMLQRYGLGCLMPCHREYCFLINGDT